MKNIIKRSINFSYNKLNFINSANHFLPKNRVPVISFSFDDFPVSAAVTGAEILKKYNIRGTYYICLGKIGQDSIGGKISDLDTIKKLIEEKHEIGNHTYDHVNIYNSSIEFYEESVLKNEQSFRELFLSDGLQTFAYPFGIVSKDTKRIAAKYFRCSRSTNPGINYDKIDLNMLKAISIYGQGEDIEFIKSAIKSTIKRNAWLNFYTHDVRENYTRFGCSPGYFETIVKLAKDSGAEILPLQEACNLIGVPTK